MSTKDYLEKDYYKVLGVPKNAKPEQIKKAFRKIARENHPDQHPGDKKAEERFKQASEANDVLSDPAKRKEYDETRSLGGPGGPGGFRFNRSAQGGGPGVNVNDLFRNMGGAGSMGAGGLGDILGGLFGQGGTGTSTRVNATPRRGADVEGQASISFRDAVEGTTVKLRMLSDDPCPVCHGTGAEPGTMPRVCPTCEGSGVQVSMNGTTVPCPTCHGRGLIVDHPCHACHGSGRAEGTHTMQIRIPAGVTDGQRIRVRGKGASGENGAPRRPVREGASGSRQGVRPFRRQSHRQGAGHLPGGRAGHGDLGADTDIRFGAAAHPGGHPLGAHLPRARQGRVEGQGRPR